jgi:hypothetical protein
VVTREQLLAAGLTARQIKRRLEKGALLREYPGVYRVGHRAPSAEARYLAAVWACGEEALLSGRAAGHLLGLLATPPSMPEVTSPTEHHIPGIRTQRCRTAREPYVWRGIPVTTPARTLVDLASVLAVSDLARACHETGIRYGGPTTASPSSSTATATTAHATHGRRIAAASERPTLAATTSGATRTATSSRNPGPMMRELRSIPP